MRGGGQGALPPDNPCQRAIRCTVSAPPMCATGARGADPPPGPPFRGEWKSARAARKGRAACPAGAVPRAAALQGARCAAVLHKRPPNSRRREAARFFVCSPTPHSRACAGGTSASEAPRASPCAAQQHSPRAAPCNKLHSPKASARFACAPCCPTALSLTTPKPPHCISSGRNVRGRFPRPARSAPRGLRTQT